MSCITYFIKFWLFLPNFYEKHITKKLEENAVFIVNTLLITAMQFQYEKTLFNTLLLTTVSFQHKILSNFEEEIEKSHLSDNTIYVKNFYAWFH